MIDGVHDSWNEYVIGRAELLSRWPTSSSVPSPSKMASPLSRPDWSRPCPASARRPTPCLFRKHLPSPPPPRSCHNGGQTARSSSSRCPAPCSPLATGKHSRSLTSKRSSQRPLSPSAARRTSLTSLQRSLLLPTRSTSTTRTTVLHPHRPRRTRLLRQRVQQQSPNQCVFHCRHCSTFAQRARRDASPPQSPKAYVGASFADMLAHIHLFRAHL